MCPAPPPNIFKWSDPPRYRNIRHNKPHTRECLLANVYGITFEFLKKWKTFRYDHNVADLCKLSDFVKGFPPVEHILKVKLTLCFDDFSKTPKNSKTYITLTYRNRTLWRLIYFLLQDEKWKKTGYTGKKNWVSVFETPA